MQDESLHCEYGLGVWVAVVDDSDTYVLNPKSGWWDQGQNADQVDLYMFGHGHAYKQAPCSQGISGKIDGAARCVRDMVDPVVQPEHARPEDIVEEYKAHALPLDVFVRDTDCTKGMSGEATRTQFVLSNDSMNNIRRSTI